MSPVPNVATGHALGIFGAGASGREVAWLAETCLGAGAGITFIVDQPELAGRMVNGFPAVHIDEFAKQSSGTPVCVAVGDPADRERCVRACSSLGLQFISLVHPRAETSRWVSIGEGTIVCAGSILTTNVDIGRHVHVNIGCTISHDATIGDYSTLSPGVHIAGWVTLGRRVFLGTGANVINGSAERRLHIGDDAIVGAGACVIADVAAGETVVGVPAAPLPRR
ncbi:MAG TPA: acetyltransferase [Casimicrobiaceae bacterium]|nr:acetyltransferase [Casimicrobiaceae bacterium]